MNMLHRHYRINDLNFRDFWDICSHYQKIHPKYRQIRYSVDGFGFAICEDEPDVAKVLHAISKQGNEVRRFVARFYQSESSEPGDYGNARIIYLPDSYDFLEPGLHYDSLETDKLLIYRWEDFIYSSYTHNESPGVDLEYGLPCEVLAVVIDLRGFSAFSEKPEVESPYICGLMTAFYNMVRRGFERYPPELIKFLGDGILAVWETTSRDRQVAIETCMEGLRVLPGSWKRIIRGPEFTHGAPDGIGNGVSFGLASKIMLERDYIGRPVNIASRLCALCPAGRTYISQNVPEGENLPTKPMVLNVKSYGEQKVWVLESL